MYITVATDSSGFTARHRAWTLAAAIDWMRQYPAHVADTVYILRLGRIVRARLV